MTLSDNYSDASECKPGDDSDTSDRGYGVFPCLSFTTIIIIIIKITTPIL